MSQEIFEMMQSMDIKTIETQIALQCAPLLSGQIISAMGSSQDAYEINTVGL